MEEVSESKETNSLHVYAWQQKLSLHAAVLALLLLSGSAKTTR